MKTKTIIMTCLASLLVACSQKQAFVSVPVSHIDIEQLKELAKMVMSSSLCGLGKTAPNPVLSTLQNFEEEYREHIYDKKCRTGTCKKLTTLVIDPEKCIGCTKCARNCPVNAISGTVKRPHSIDPTKCIKCGTCKTGCPVHAIKEA